VIQDSICLQNNRTELLENKKEIISCKGFADIFACKWNVTLELSIINTVKSSVN